MTRGETYNDRRKDVVAEREADRTRELHDRVRERGDGEDGGGLEDGTHHAPAHGAQRGSFGTVLAHAAV